MSEEDSKLNMLQVLAPNAMKAYKRKKLTIFPSGSPNHSVEGQAEMELDDEEGNNYNLFVCLHTLKLLRKINCD